MIFTHSGVLGTLTRKNIRMLHFLVYLVIGLPAAIGTQM
jgi:hypothetical protein